MPALREQLSRPTDRLGRQQLHPLKFINFLESMPWLTRAFSRDVPPTAVAFEGDAATVTCPCGEQPQVSMGEMCSCKCGRYFLHAGTVVKVARPEVG